MKKKLAALGLGVSLLVMAGMAQASLVTIGTATYLGSDYNLIWNNDNNGNSVVWLDYTNNSADWSAQTAWAAGLDSQLTYNIDAGYTVTWDSAWRLPSAGADPISAYNQTTSEMGDLFYNELGLSAYPTLTTAAQLNATNFDNLIAHWYWSGTEDDQGGQGGLWGAWAFGMYSGDQSNYSKNNNIYGLALRGGQVSAVPIPGTLWFFGSGLAGLVTLRRRRKGNHG